MVVGVGLNVKGSLGRDIGYGYLCVYLGENCFNELVRGSLGFE